MGREGDSYDFEFVGREGDSYDFEFVGREGDSYDFSLSRFQFGTALEGPSDVAPNGGWLGREEKGTVTISEGKVRGKIQNVGREGDSHDFSLGLRWRTPAMSRPTEVG